MRPSQEEINALQTGELALVTVWAGRLTVNVTARIIRQGKGDFRANVKGGGWIQFHEENISRLGTASIAGRESATITLSPKRIPIKAPGGLHEAPIKHEKPFNQTIAPKKL